MVFLKVPGTVGKSLDARADRIRDELEEARRLREEAQSLLAEYQRKRKEAEKEATEIVAIAQREAHGLLEEARKKTEEYVARRNKLAEQKIAQAEIEAVNEVRASAVDIAVAAASRILAEKVDTKTSVRPVQVIADGSEIPLQLKNATFRSEQSRRKAAFFVLG